MELDGKTVCMLVGPGYEDLEMWVVAMRLQEAGAKVVLAGSRAGETVSSKHGCLEATSEAAAGELAPEAFSAVVIPGGWAPDKLRRDPGVRDFVRAMNDAGKVVGMICHAGLVGISAGIVSGRRATGSEGIRDDLINAGAEWVDEPAIRDGNLVWGRVVADIPAFSRLLIPAIAGQ